VHSDGIVGPYIDRKGAEVLPQRSNFLRHGPTASQEDAIESSQPQSPQPQQPQQPPSRSQSLRRRFPRSGKRKMLELPLSSSNSSSKCNILAKKRRIECPVSSDMDPVQLSQDSMYENLAAAKKISVSQQPLYSTSSEA
jgi:hypothetical protein